jgi:hypothetical protein
LSSRRQFLTGCSALTLAAATAPAAMLAAPFSRRDGPLDAIGFHQFAEHVGTSFRVWQNSAAAVDLILTEAQPKAIIHASALHAPDARNEKFSLMFQGPGEIRLEQDTYIFDHSNLGPFPMFIVPMYSSSKQFSFYQAIFNRPITARNRRGR